MKRHAVQSDFDLAIVGGGLAGLSLAIQLAQRQMRIVLVEQHSYPFHRVCGEYIAMESWDFLTHLGLPLADMNLPQIRRLLVTEPGGLQLQRPLKPGGFGISRYRLDFLLAQRARACGVTLYESTQVREVRGQPEAFRLHLGGAQAGELTARLVCGAFGKYANLDRQLRPHELPQQTGTATFLAVKYHLRLRFPADLIALHNFDGGYCGISRIEEGRVCCCYLVSQEAFERADRKIPNLEAQVLGQNPYLASILKHAEHLYEKPQTIARVHFHPRSAVWGHMPMLGDAAGLIPPLCGNGMSMAFHSSYILAQLLIRYDEGELSWSELERAYQKQWHKQFGLRLTTGRALQRSFGQLRPIRLLLRGLRHLPGLSDSLIRATHGQNIQEAS